MRHARGLISLVAVFAALGFLVWHWPSATVWQAVLNPSRLAALTGFSMLFCAAVVVRAIRWHYLMSSQLHERFATTLKAYVWFFAIGGYTPMRAGELLRVGWVKSRGGSGTFATGAFLAEKLADVTALLLLLGLVALAKTVPKPLEGTFSAITALLLIGYFILIFLAQRTPDRLNRSVTKQSLRSRFDLLLSAVPIPSAGRPFWSFQILTLLVWGLLTIGFLVYLKACYPNIHWSAAPMCLAMVNLSTFLGGPPGNLGVYEAFFAISLQAYGINFEEGVATAVVLHFVALATTGLIAIVSKCTRPVVD